MIQRLIFLVIFLFSFSHFCNALEDEEEDSTLPLIATIKKYIPERYDNRQGDLAFEQAQISQNKSDNLAVDRHAVLLSLGNQCLEASKVILSRDLEAALRILPDRYTPIRADESHLILYDSLTKTTLPFPRIEVKADLLLLALSYAEASDRCLPREIKLRIARSERLKDAILIACADSYEVAAHHEIRPFKFSAELRETLAPYCLYYKTLYEELVNKKPSYTEFLTGLEYLMGNGIILRSTSSHHAVFQDLPLIGLFEDYLRLKDSWTQRHKAVTEYVKLLVPPSLARLRQVDAKKFETTVDLELKTLSQQVSILQAINTQLKECISTYQTKLHALRLSSSSSPIKSTTISAIEITTNVIEKVRVFIERNYSFFTEAYRERIMRLYSLVGTLKATKSSLAIPNLQDIMLKGPHFDPTSFIKDGKQLEQITNNFKLLAYTLKEQAAIPLPAASKSGFSLRRKLSHSQTRLGSRSTPSISHSISTIVGSSTGSSEDEATLSPQGSPTHTLSCSSSSQGTP